VEAGAATDCIARLKNGERASNATERFSTLRAGESLRVKPWVVDHRQDFTCVRPKRYHRANSGSQRFLREQLQVIIDRQYKILSLLRGHEFFFLSDTTAAGIDGAKSTTVLAP
jgi:hypothetical protein